MSSQVVPVERVLRKLFPAGGGTLGYVVDKAPFLFNNKFWSKLSRIVTMKAGFFGSPIHIRISSETRPKDSTGFQRPVVFEQA